MNYIDEENDTISLSDDSDLREALRVAKNFKNGILRIQLVASNSLRSAPQPTGSENPHNQIKEQFLQTFRQLKTSIPLLTAINEEEIASQIFNSQSSITPIVLGPYTQAFNLDPACLTQTVHQQLPQIISTVLSQMGPLLGTMMMAPPSSNPFCTPFPNSSQNQPFGTQSSSNPNQPPTQPQPQPQPQPQFQPQSQPYVQTFSTQSVCSLDVASTNQEPETLNSIQPTHSQPSSVFSTIVPPSSGMRAPESTQETPSLTPFEAQFFEEKPFQYEEELKVLEGMGFTVRSQLIWRLKKFKGNLAAVIEDLLME